jgi:aminoglycoside phosphotransferase (APT) family kinase protein
MELRPAIQIQSMIKAMTDVVLPGLQPQNQLAQEQARLVIGMLQLMAQRLPLQFRYDRDELERYLALSSGMLNQLEGGERTHTAAEDLRSAAFEGCRVADRARAEPAELEAAVFDLRAKLAALVQAVDEDGEPSSRARLERLVLVAAKEQIDRERAWVSAMGFDDPSAVPSIDELLHAPDAKAPSTEGSPVVTRSTGANEPNRIAIDKNRPSGQWIEDLRRRFPCEAEIDRVLTRKLARRGEPPYSPARLEDLSNGVQALLHARLDDNFAVTGLRWLTGGASKIQIAFELTWNRPGIGRTTTPMVLRMQPPESIVETSRMREFQLMKAFEGVVPVPSVFWVDEVAEFLPYPAIILEFRPGVTRPSSGAGGISGLGTKFGAAARRSLGRQFVQHLAVLHTRDWRDADLSAFDIPAPGTQAALWQINWWGRVWEEDANEDVPLMRLAAAWMRANVPRADALSVVHGDYRTGNFLYTEDDNRISAILDWELGHLGDRHEDLAWTLKPAWGHLAEDCATFLVGGLVSRSEFLDSYQQASALDVDPAKLRFYGVLNEYKNVVITLASTYRVARGGKGHQDVLLTYLLGVAYPMLENLRAMLHELI